jgi:hypothetical protein
MKYVLVLAALAIALVGCNGLSLKLPPLHEAAKAGDLAEVKRLVEGGTDVNLLDDRGDNALYWAMLSPNWGSVSEYLIAKGINVNHVGDDGYAELDRLELGGATQEARWLRGKGGRRATNDTTKAAHAQSPL